MRGEPLSNCEKTFILESFEEGKVRIDQRKNDDFRAVKVIVGSDFGTCLAMIGKTKVFAQVSCHLVEPRSARGNMGSVEVQVDMSPMSSPQHEDGRLGPRGIELTRVLEQLLRSSGVIDLESLCLRAYKQVWQIRVDVHVLDLDGALIDCSSIAAITALAHFRRPDVTVLPDTINIHTFDEKLPIPLNIYHMPICVSFGIITDREIIIADPKEREEMCLRGTFVVAANKRHEICALHQTGNLILNKELIVRCAGKAIQRAVDVTELIMSVIADDNLKRSKREKIPGFSKLIALDMLTSHACEPNLLIAPAVETLSLQMEASNEEEIVITEAGHVQIGEDNNRITGESLRQVTESDLRAQIADIAANNPAVAAAIAYGEADDREVEQLLAGIRDEFGPAQSEQFDVPEQRINATPKSPVEKAPALSSGAHSDEMIQLSDALRKRKKKK